VDRAKKGELIDSLRTVFQGTTALVVVHNLGLTVGQMTDFRAKLRAAGAGFRVTKNRLARIALDGTRYTAIGDLFKGPTGVAFSKDPVAAAKVAVAFAKQNERLAIVGGALAEIRLDADGIKALAELPSLDALRAKLVGLIAAPATRIAGVLQAPAGQLARVLKAHADKQQAAA